MVLEIFAKLKKALLTTLLIHSFSRLAHNLSIAMSRVAPLAGGRVAWFVWNLNVECCGC